MKTFQIVGTYEDDGQIYISQPFQAETPAEALLEWKKFRIQELHEDGCDVESLVVEFIIEGQIQVHEVDADRLSFSPKWLAYPSRQEAST